MSLPCNTCEHKIESSEIKYSVFGKRSRTAVLDSWCYNTDPRQRWIFPNPGNKPFLLPQYRQVQLYCQLCFLKTAFDKKNKTGFWNMLLNTKTWRVNFPWRSQVLLVRCMRLCLGQKTPKIYIWGLNRLALSISKNIHLRSKSTGIINFIRKATLNTINRSMSSHHRDDAFWQ